MVTIADEHFDTQKQLLARLRLLIKNKTDILKPRNQVFAVDIVQRYNKVYEIGKEVKRVYVDVNRATVFPELCMHVVFIGAATITVAVRNVARAAMSLKDAGAVSARRPIDTKLEELRTIVQPDIQAFKKRAYEIGSPLCCTFCKRDLTDEKREQVHVDHCGVNTEFRHLVERFRNQENLTTILDIGAESFNAFHSTVAQLQILCAPCNMKKKRSDQV